MTSREDDVDWSSMEKPDMPRCSKLLFVAVDKTTDKRDASLNLKGEHDKIYEALRPTYINDFSHTFAGTWEEVAKNHRDRNPLILHFGCHSETKVIKLFRFDLSPKNLADALQAHNKEAKTQVQLVVLNSCFSNEHARKLAEVVDFAIGHEDELGDDSAIEFSGIFYQSLFQGYSLLYSFQLAKCMSAGYSLHGRRDASAFRLPGNLHRRIVSVRTSSENKNLECDLQQGQGDFSSHGTPMLLSSRRSCFIRV